ncbi:MULTISPECIES: hypothetical protein [Sphingobacterium]|jgi:hypothetical protein|uniref:hypothetical protein n=1 Tax=Sphingobacterium TaxID=28453 RepID=UPI0025EEDA11|nr:hypothetical protein [Sphingobacterium sp. UBA6320]
MEEIKSNFELILERLKSKSFENDNEEKIRDFDFEGMFHQLDKSLDEYKKDYMKKSSDSEQKLSELVLTS